MSSKFGRWLFLNWPGLYLKTGVAVWLTKAGIDTKETLDNYKQHGHDFENAILENTAINLAYYSPNVLFWSVGFAVDGYKWGVIKYYDRQSKK
jgi:hypothetical protein